MSILSRFGVPLGGGQGRGGILQPKVKWKFRVRVINFGAIAGGLELTQNVDNVSRPTFIQAEQAVHSYNSTAYYGGKPEWGSISIQMRDDVSNVLSNIVGHQVQKQMNHFEQTSPIAASNYKFHMFIETMDGGNDAVLEQWVLEGCFVTNVAYDSFDYSSSEAMRINMDIRYDVATQSGGLMPLLPQLIDGVMLG